MIFKLLPPDNLADYTNSSGLSCLVLVKLPQPRVTQCKKLLDALRSKG